MLLFGLLFAVGGLMLYEWQAAAMSTMVAAAGLWIMRVAGRMARLPGNGGTSHRA